MLAAYEYCFAEMAPSDLKQCLLLLSLLSLASCAVNYTTVFVHGEGGWPCIRIPAITQCGGMLHAFAECRTKTGDGCIPTAPEKPTGIRKKESYM